MDREQVFRSRVYAYGLILTVLVILVHSYNADLFGAGELSGFPAFCRSFEYFFSVTLGQAAVPGFFLMSGYLFFRTDRPEGIGKEFFLRKLKNRIFTLVIPYLAWNLIYMLIYRAAGRTQLTPENIFNGIFNFYYNPVFWYMKQLILLSVLTPVMYLLLRDRFFPVMLFLSFLTAANYALLPFHIVNEDACFYYMAGAAAALHGRRRIEESPAPALRNAALLFFAAAAAALFLQEKGGLYAVILYRVLAAADMFLLVSCLYPGSVRTASLMKLNFYTYAVHYLIIRAALMAVRGMFGDGPAPLFLLYVLLPPLCLAGAAASAAVLRRLSPRLFRVLTGGRCG